MRAALALAGVLLSSVPAHAGPVEDGDDKTVGTAIALPLGGLAAAGGMIALGLTTDRHELLMAGTLAAAVAPSFGHWYAHDYLTPGLVVRVGGGGLAVAGFLIALAEGWSPGGTPDYAGYMMVGGSALAVGGAIYDIATGPEAARRFNSKHRISIAPSSVSTGGTAGYGLSIGGSF